MHTLIPAFRRQQQAGLCEFEASLFYTAISRTDRITKRDPVSKKKNLLGNLHLQNRPSPDSV